MTDIDEGGGASKSTDPAAGSSAATDVSLREYGVLRSSWQRRYDELDRDWMWRFMQERDRRYAEVQAERDKAEVIRAETQTYKDRQGNELREQLARERLDYASKGDLVASVETINATLKPLVEYVAGQQGSRQGSIDQRTLIAWGIAAIAGVLALAQFIGGLS